jgi:L-fuconate dehydratase
VIHIATGAVDNALWDLYARARQKPLWKLLVDMSPVGLGLAQRKWPLTDAPLSLLQEELVKSATFRYITDAITPDEALAILKAKEATKSEREATVRSQG